MIENVSSLLDQIEKQLSFWITEWMDGLANSEMNEREWQDQYMDGRSKSFITLSINNTPIKFEFRGKGGGGCVKWRAGFFKNYYIGVSFIYFDNEWWICLPEFSGHAKIDIESLTESMEYLLRNDR